MGDSSVVKALEESVDAPLGQMGGRWRYRMSTPTIDVLSEEEDVVVASPASVETVPEPSPRLEMEGPANIPFAEARARTISLIGASKSTAQPQR